ncbi:hypothetical protein [Deinococcus sp. Marseille-Q6407]|uniref:hypothetical protein n=1 Tax=Deinococcus sp. Marseille-Q6407 TaxID=2969223 RepID=UPI0021BEE2C9|nr:hypothetical protein [Deinococcus sp. Marseille-Q6407]
MPRMLWPLLLPALVACAPAHTLATPAEEAALDRALLADFWEIGSCPIPPASMTCWAAKGRLFTSTPCVRTGRGKARRVSGGQHPAVSARL